MIHYHTFCCDLTYKHAIRCIELAKYLSDTSIKYVAWTLNMSDDNIKKLSDAGWEIHRVKKTSWNGMGGSVQHGEGMLECFRSLDCSTTNIISDSDIYLMFDGWDSSVLERLDQVDCIGIGYEDSSIRVGKQFPINAFRSQPGIMWLALKRDLPWNQFDPRPNKSDTTPLTVGERKLYGLPAGVELLRDTGWQIPQFLKDNSLTGEKFGGPYWNSSTTDVKPRIKVDGDDYYDEYHIDNDPFLVHVKSGRRRDGDEIFVKVNKLIGRTS